MTTMHAIFNGVQWEAVAPSPGPLDDRPYVTHRGELELPGMGVMRVYRLSDGMAVINSEDIERVFGGPDTLPEVRKLLDENRITFRE